MHWNDWLSYVPAGTQSCYSDPLRMHKTQYTPPWLKICVTCNVSNHWHSRKCVTVLFSVWWLSLMVVDVTWFLELVCTPKRHVFGIHYSQYCIPKLHKKRSLEWLCEIVCYHLFCWTILNLHLSFLNLVCDKEVTNVNVVCFLFVLEALSFSLGWMVLVLSWYNKLLCPMYLSFFCLLS